MTNIYEKLIDEHDDLEIYECKMIHRGLYSDGIIHIKENMPVTEKACILAEEIGHYKTTTGSILNQKDLGNVKQEKRARRWAHSKLIEIDDFISAFKHGCRNRFEIADYLGITEEFLEEAIQLLGEKYGAYYTTKKYVVTFEPLGILKMY